MLVAFALTRIAYYRTGARFDDGNLDTMWHFISLDLLKTRLLESVYYLHFQPPLYNLYLGTVVKLFGSSSHLGFVSSYLALGVCFTLILQWLLRALGFGLLAASWLTLFVVGSPASLLFESYLLYTYPVIVAMSAAAASLLLAAQSGKRTWWGCFFGLLALIVLTRALFHPMWMLLVTVGVVAIRRSDRRRVLLAAALPLLLVASVCVKNWVVFGVPGTSSWLGMSMARMTVRVLPAAERRRWIRQGHLSRLSEVKTPGLISEYASRMQMPAATGIPVLDEPLKPTGVINLHHLAYVEIARRLAGDARYVLRHRPDVYLDSVKGALQLFVSPATSWRALTVNPPHIRRYVDAYNSIVHFPGPLGPSGLMLYLLPLSSLWGALMAWRRLRGARSDALGLTFAFMATSIAYVSAAGCLLEPHENMRFRLLAETFVWVCSAHMLLQASRAAIARFVWGCHPASRGYVANMADDTTQRGAADRTRINLKEEHEVAYWTKALGVSREQLQAAVQKVGVMASDVRRNLGK